MKNINHKIKLSVTFAALFLSIAGANAQQKETNKFTGGLQDTTNPKLPYPVRNDTATRYDEMVTIRYSRIKKGTFPVWLKVSQEGVWPYFERLGVRVVGAWLVTAPPQVEGVSPTPDDYDEIYLMTRYANIEHWKATRDPVKLGGNGPAYDKCAEALKIRESISFESTVKFLKGSMAQNGPYFLPGLPEKYELKLP